MAGRARNVGAKHGARQGCGEVPGGPAGRGRQREPLSALADAEADPQTSAIFRKLAAVEDAHAEFWRKNLDRIGAQIPAQHPGWRSRALARLARRFGPEFVLPSINVLEHVDSDANDRQPEAIERGLPLAERSHARVLDVLAGKSGSMAGSAIAQLEGRHRAIGGNALRAAVPVLPLFVTHGLTATIWSGIRSAAALAAVGVGTSFFTGRSALFSAGRQIAIGALAAAVTFGMGALFGVALAG